MFGTCDFATREWSLRLSWGGVRSWLYGRKGNGGIGRREIPAGIIRNTLKALWKISWYTFEGSWRTEKAGLVFQYFDTCGIYGLYFYTLDLYVL
jgi:hypothetical protein